MPLCAWLRDRVAACAWRAEERRGERKAKQRLLTYDLLQGKNEETMRHGGCAEKNCDAATALLLLLVLFPGKRPCRLSGFASVCRGIDREGGTPCNRFPPFERESGRRPQRRPRPPLLFHVRTGQEDVCCAVTASGPAEFPSFAHCCVHCF